MRRVVRADMFVATVLPLDRPELVANSSRRSLLPLTDVPSGRASYTIASSNLDDEVELHVLDPSRIAAIADELAAAERDRTTVPLLTARNPDMTVDDAYAVQKRLGRRRASRRAPGSSGARSASRRR